jgi:hypothetical protein
MKLVERVKGLLLTPRLEWKVIEQEAKTPSDLFIDYVAIIAAIPEVARFVGQTLIGDYAPVVPSLVRMVLVYLLNFMMVYTIACVIDQLAPRFEGQKNFDNAVKLSVYSYTPLWLAGIFLLIPGLSFLLILGAYGLYLLWTGLPLLMQVPEEQALPYAAVVTGCALVAAVVLTFV